MWPVNMKFFQAKVTILTPNSGLPDFEKHIQELLLRVLAHLLALPKAIILTWYLGATQDRKNKIQEYGYQGNGSG